MHTDHAHAPGERPGFTLIEMLVVLGIILTLSALTVLFMPRIQERQKVARGADFLQGWLLKAKQRARADRIATGVRLQPSAQNASYVLNLQYIQKPNDYSPNDLLIRWAPVMNVCSFGSGVHLLGSAPSGLDEASLVQRGDYLQLQSEGLVHRITDVKDNQCTLASNLLPPNVALPQRGASFRIIRQPRLLAGEQALQLPQDVAVDVGKSLNVSPLLRSSISAWEILFAPSGSVVGQGTGNTPIVLWLRDVTQDANTPGDQTLIAIYPRTGLVAAHPMAQGGDPYQFIRDGRSSGF